LSVPAGKRAPWELAPPDVVPWHGDTEHGPCDADDVFSVRELVRKIAPLLIGSGCEKYVMDADKMLNDLPTDRDTTRMPACKNNFIVKSTAKTVYSVEKCAIKALAKAEHVNATEENKIKELVKELTDRRRHVLVPLSMFSTPAKFAGKAKMSKKDWDSFEKSGAAGTLAMDWGGSGGTAGRMQKWPGQPGRYGRPRGMRPGQHGQHMQQWAGQGQGPGGNYGPEGRYGDSYGERPHPKPPLQPGMVPGGGGMGGMGTGQELTPKQQYRQNVVDHAKELAKANEDIVGPFKRGKHLEEFPPPVQPLKPIYPYPQPPILESETASVSKFPVFSGPDAPDVDISISAAFPLNAPDSFAVGAAFLLLSSVQQEGRRRSQAFEFLAVPLSERCPALL
ncbi:ANKRD50, partial [Symbiodinium natans]